MNRNDLSINFISAFVSVGFLFLEGERVTLLLVNQEHINGQQVVKY